MLKRKMDVTSSMTSLKTKKIKLGERFHFEVKVIPVGSQSEDSESEATEESDEEQDDLDRTEGLGSTKNKVAKLEERKTSEP